MKYNYYPFRISMVIIIGFAIITLITSSERKTHGTQEQDPEYSTKIFQKPADLSTFYQEVGSVIGAPKSAGWQEYTTTCDPKTGEVPFDQLWEAKLYAESLRNNDGTSPSDVKWEERGPSNVGGRTRALMFDPNDPAHKKVWAGSVSGGLWYTNDITADPPTWNKIDDFWERLPVGCMAYDPTSPNIFYVGTGEGYMGYWHMPGAGIYKSTDGGATWDTITSTFFTADFRKVNDIAVHPVTGDVYAATRGTSGNDGGILRSKDQGVTWEVVLDKNTSPTSTPSNRGADIEIASDNLIYVTTGYFESGGIYRSSTGDAGDWTEITTGIDIPATERIELAVAPSASNVLYCVAEDTTGSSDVLGVYRTTNRGGNWTAVTTPMRDATTSFATGQAWYDLILWVHPTNHNLVFAGGVKMFKSTDGGTTWTEITQIHDDHHAMLSRPGFVDELAFGTDGGVYYTDDCTDSPVDVDDKNNGYNVTQFYTVAYHPNCYSNYFLGGTQDNGTPRFESPGINATTEANNGDGAYCYISQIDPRYQVTARQWNNYYKSTDFGASFHFMGSGITRNWLIPPAVYDDEEDALYSSYNGDSLLRIRNYMHSHIFEYLTGIGFGSTISAFKKNPFATNLITFGTNEGRLFGLENASHETGWLTWEYNTTPLPDANISSIDFGPSSNQILLTFSNYNTVSVWETLDGGSNWHNREGDLPNMPIRWGLYNPYDYKQVLVATELGIWTTEDITVPNPNWVPCNGGLANVRVNRLELHESNMEIYAATYGRGIFTSTSLNAIPYQKVMASDGSNSARFGTDVDIFGNYAIAGAPGDNQVRGAAYVFKFNGNIWEESDKLTAINGIPGDYFGGAVATDGNYAVIGAEYDDDKAEDAGAAYIFQRSGDTWTQKAKLTADDGAKDDQFGCSVAKYANYVAIGAYKDEPIGSVYIFKWDGNAWTQTFKITPDPTDVLNFGYSVALDNDTLLVGSSGGSPDYEGKISIYTRNVEDWDFFYDYEGHFDENLGTDVALQGDYYIGGAPRYDSEPADNSGGVYVIKRSSGGWSINTPLYPPDCWYHDGIGVSVDIYGDYIIAGSTDAGEVSIYKKSGFSWDYFMRLHHQDVEPLDLFGASVGLSSQYAMVSNPFDNNEFGDYAGSVYFFRNYASGLTQPDLSVVPLQRDVPASSSHADFDVFNLGTGTMDWTAAANDPWLTIASGSSGTDDGSIRVEFTNNDYCTRTGTITVASPGALNSPQMIEITQTATGTEDEKKLVPNQLQAYDYFGRAVAIDGDVAVIGSYGDDDKGNFAGSAYIYEYDGNTWIQRAKFYPNDAAAGDYFGMDVSISGDYILVGAYGKDSTRGAAYLFRKPSSGWQNISEAAKFTASDGGAGDSFGRYVDISGDYAIVSSPGGSQSIGAVYFFDRPLETGWADMTETVKLIGHDVAEGDHFGSDVAISGTFAVVGSYNDDGKGSAYIFQRSWVWMESCKLTASDGLSGDQFGYSVEIWGDNIIAGANRADNDKGSAYLFKKPSSGWADMTETFKLVSNDRDEDDYFGQSVGIHEYNALVGAHGDDENGTSSGAAYGFIFNDTTTWLEEKYMATDGKKSDYYGRSVGITYQYSIIGAYGCDDKGSSAGAAYIYCNSCETVCTPEISLTPSGTIIFPQTDGKDTVEIVNTGNCTMTWRARSSASWLTIDGDSTGTGDGEVAVTYTSNPGNERTAQLVFTSEEAFNAPESVTFTQSQGPDIVLDSDTVSIGEDLCWFATNSVTVPGSGGYYVIEDDAQVTIVAGGIIHFVPGMKAEPGCYLQAYIGTDPCPSGPVADEPLEEEENLLLEDPENVQMQSQDDRLLIFPNPARNRVNLLFSEETSGDKVCIELYSIMGNLTRKQELPYSKIIILNLETIPEGIYIIRVRIDNIGWRSEKLIVQ